LNNQNKTALVTFSLSVILSLIGIIFLGFTYIIYPKLVPFYGGGEPFILASYNDYSDIFPWYSNSKLHLTIEANNTIQVYVDGKNPDNGTYYVITIEPRVETLIRLKSSLPVEGRFNAWQEPPVILQISAIVLFFTGLILTGLFSPKF
jgi:hypothetical protein